MTMRCFALVGWILIACAPLASAAERRLGELWFKPFEIKLQAGKTWPAELGRLVVLENRTEPESNLIEIAFVRIKSTSANPGPPIFELSGGPGSSGVAQARAYLMIFKGLLEVGDVILLDQRGVGLSRPNLEDPRPYAIPPDMLRDSPEALEIILEVNRQAHEDWTRKGVDLRGYTTVESADDIDAIRRALGYEKMSLFGRSYGSHLGLAAVRRHGDKIHRAVLSGIEGPNHTIATPSQIQTNLEAIAEIVESDPDLGPHIPDFLAMVERVLTRLDNSPVMVEIAKPRSNEKINVAVGKFIVQQWAANSIGRGAAAVKDLPATFYAMDRGDFRYLASLKARNNPGLRSAMSIVMDCASGMEPERYDRIQREAQECLLGDMFSYPYTEVCKVWGSPDLGREFRSELRSDVRILMLSGTLDGGTPVRNAEELLPGLPNAEHIVVVNAGHEGRLFSSPQSFEQMLMFFKDQPLTRHRIEFPPPEFTKIRPGN